MLRERSRESGWDALSSSMVRDTRLGDKYREGKEEEENSAFIAMSMGRVHCVAAAAATMCLVTKKGRVLRLPSTSATVCPSGCIFVNHVKNESHRGWREGAFNARRGVAAQHLPVEPEAMYKNGYSSRVGIPFAAAFLTLWFRRL